MRLTTTELWKIHPVFDLYAGSTLGRILHITTGNILSPTQQQNGYVRVSVRGKSMRQQQNIYLHRFICSCFNNDFDIFSDMEIDHINNIRNDNRYANLVPTTTTEHNRKAQQTRDMAKIRCGQRVDILAENTITHEKLLFRSKYKCGKYFSRSPSMVGQAADPQNIVKGIVLNNVLWSFRIATYEESSEMPFTTVSISPIVDTD